MSRRKSILKAIVWETQLKNQAIFSLEKGTMLPVFKCLKDHYTKDDTVLF